MDTTATERVEIVLEDVATTSPWRRIATTLGGTQGTQFLRFVARRQDGSVGGAIGAGTDRDVRVSGSFPVMALQRRDELDADEAWGGEVRDRFDELHAQLLQDGWRPEGRGDQWWSLVLRRPAPGAAPDEGVVATD
ncbi:hypothetical protein [Salsipaludibacter albus]|uniref:hypothetical protein n=1 Tax=Salsipaludibacter albus TaxID=2849650 RepID=UPI001EE4A8CB|nr:hypothetical protein [Salsipaludibacter albus]MBY5161075.1 hypothetical protein [Salsipaludibacter albus]